MPEVETDKHILEWANELGFCEQGFSGPTPLTYQEIHAWATMTGVIPTWEESRFIKMLSNEYCSQYAASSDRDAPPPYSNEEYDRRKVADQILTAFRSHSKYRGTTNG